MEDATTIYSYTVRHSGVAIFGKVVGAYDAIEFK